MGSFLVGQPTRFSLPARFSLLELMIQGLSRAKNRTISSAMPAAQNNFVRTIRNSFRRKKKHDVSNMSQNVYVIEGIFQLTKDFETDQNENLDQNVPRDPKQTIKSNDANNEFNVKSGIANYKCKVHCLKIPNLTLEFSS